MSQVGLLFRLRDGRVLGGVYDVFSALSRLEEARKDPRFLDFRLEEPWMSGKQPKW